MNPKQIKPPTTHWRQECNEAANDQLSPNSFTHTTLTNQVTKLKFLFLGLSIVKTFPKDAQKKKKKRQLVGAVTVSCSTPWLSHSITGLAHNATRLL